jgi:hypothetical protein
VTIVYGVVPEPVLSAAPVVVRSESRTFWVESLDRSVVVPFDNAPVVLRAGFLGLDDAPDDVVTSTSPGVDGSFLEELRTLPRAFALPLSIVARTQAEAWAAKAALKAVMRPRGVQTFEGTFRLVCSSSTGTRELTAVYRSGLEGDDTGVPQFDRMVVNCEALDPFARDRTERVVEFTLGDSTGSMVSATPATAGPRQLGSSVVIGDAMPIDIVSGIPVWPRIDFVGPFSPLTVTASTGMSISVPGGVPAGQTLTIITDPRNKSIRLDGALAAGMVARGSKVGAPFLPGLNHLSVAATGATSASRIVLSWRGGWRSLW